MENFIGGTMALFGDPMGIMVFFGGLFGGMIFGAVPGVSMLTLAAILLPFSGDLAPSHAVMLFSVIYCSGVFGGAITAILFNIPGAPENAPTAFDGYQMTLKGQAGKAVGAAVMCSSLGGTCSAVMMMAATPLIAGWAITAFGPSEIASLVFFGIVVAASVGSSNLWKGFLSVLLGMLLATVGLDPVGGISRYAFDVPYLLAGIAFVPLILGMFAVSEVFIQLENRSKGSYTPPKVNLDFPTFAEFWKLRIAVVRSVFIGFFAGVLPGIGATLAAFMGYNEAVRWSKDKSKFGKGELEGVVSPETANNAATGAAMIPLLALGLPGGALTAMMIGVFQIHNIEPGPLVFINSKDLVWIVFAAMFWANICIFGLGWIQTKTVVHLLRIPFHLLSPAILLMSTIGAYAVRGLVIDVMVMFLAGVFAFFFRKSGYSIPGIVLGLILGQIGERTFAQAMQISQYDFSSFLTRPISAFLVVVTLLTLATSVYRALRPKHNELFEGEGYTMDD